MTLFVNPNLHFFETLLTLDTSLSHHDPAVSNGSNKLLFNRAPVLLDLQSGAYTLDQALIDEIADNEPVPQDILAEFQGLGFKEFASTALVRLLMDIHNGSQGSGLFQGIERYAMLEGRLLSAATKSKTLMSFWATISREMQFEIAGADYDSRILRFSRLPKGFQATMLAYMCKETRAVMLYARMWHQLGKAMSESYALKAGVDTQAMVRIKFTAESSQSNSEIIPVEIPTVSTNSLRHMVRAASWEHFVHRVFGDADKIGIPPHNEALFVNGGNIAAGEKAPTNSSQLAMQIRETYPSIDLLGGVFSAFDLGAGRLKMASHIVCKENARALRGTPAESHPNMNVSVFEMLDDTTHTRQATQHGIGQMIFSFETMIAGTAIYVRHNLDPFTSPLTCSALHAALMWYRDRAVVGGQSARGYGWCTMDYLSDQPLDSSLYEQYLATKRDALAQGIQDKSLLPIFNK